MDVNEYIKSIGIKYTANKSEDGNYIVDLPNSDEFGRVFSILEKADDLDQVEDNQIITEQGSSLMYESMSEPYLISLLADWEADLYQLVINIIE